MENSLWVHVPSGILVLGKMYLAHWSGRFLFDEYGTEFYAPAKDYSYWSEYQL